MKDSILATTQKSESCCVSLAALIFPANSSMSARVWRSPSSSEFVLGKTLSSRQAPAALFKLPDQPTNVVEVAVSSIRVEQNRHRGCIAHELDRIKNLSPAGFVGV